MPRRSLIIINLSDSERSALETLIGRKRTQPQIALRTKIILKASERGTYREIANALGVSHEMSRAWGQRWLELKALNKAN